MRLLSPLEVPDAAYDATGWNGSAQVPTKNAVRDKVETLGSGGVASGTSFPGSPTAGDLFFRTDLGWLCYYDGTRWLTTNVESVGFNGNSSGFTSNATLYYPFPYQGSYSIYVTEVIWGMRKSTGGSWTVSLSAAGVGSFGSYNNNSDSGGAHYTHRVAVNAVKTSTPDTSLLWNITENSGTAILYVSGSMLYRVVVT